MSLNKLKAKFNLMTNSSKFMLKQLNYQFKVQKQKMTFGCVIVKDDKIIAEGLIK